MRATRGAFARVGQTRLARFHGRISLIRGQQKSRRLRHFLVLIRIGVMQSRQAQGLLPVDVNLLLACWRWLRPLLTLSSYFDVFVGGHHRWRWWVWYLAHIHRHLLQRWKSLARWKKPLRRLLLLVGWVIHQCIWFPLIDALPQSCHSTSHLFRYASCDLMRQYVPRFSTANWGSTWIILRLHRIVSLTSLPLIEEIFLVFDLWCARSDSRWRIHNTHK